MSSHSLVPSSGYVAATAIVAFFLFSSSLSEACFINNCPRGGKRSMDSGMVPKRECMKCGPNDLGQCVGPTICCSPYFGCHISTAETEKCQLENQSLTPCFVTGEVCGARDSGNCVADGICCDSDSCAANDRCKLDRGSKDEANGKTKDVAILRLLQRLLKSEEYD